VHPVLRIILVDGRDLAVADAGPESGFPVVVHNGTGSRHLFPGAVADARRAGFRLIGYDRPGLGRSRAMPGRVVADCAADGLPRPVQPGRVWHGRRGMVGGLGSILPALGFRPHRHPGPGHPVARRAGHVTPAGSFPLARGAHPACHGALPR
jgi:pimeloyl-ACP methyl ester carboxylesterase